MNQQLDDYIKQARAAGMNDEQIKSELLNSGWGKTDINPAFRGETFATTTNSESEIDQDTFVNKWSWGGFFLHWIYFIASRAPKKAFLYFLGSLVPILNIYLWIKTGLKGRKITWETGKWLNFEDYRKRQKLLDKIGVIVIVVLGGLAILGFMASILLLSLNSARIKARDVQRYADARLIESTLTTYQNDHNIYPRALNELVPSYIDHLPTAPVPGQPYEYQVENSGSDYRLCVTYEKTSQKICGSQNVLIPPAP